MKPYIMNYSETIKLNSAYIYHPGIGETIYTFTVEDSDQNNIFCLDTTEITETIEPTDQNQIFLDVTYVTKTLETSDNISQFIDTTYLTESIEPSDHDDVSSLIVEIHK